MRIASRATGREMTVAGAVQVVTGGSIADPQELRNMMVRLLEELTSDALREPVLNATQLSRVLAYAFKVEDV